MHTFIRTFCLLAGFALAFFGCHFNGEYWFVPSGTMLCTIAAKPLLEKDLQDLSGFILILLGGICGILYLGSDRVHCLKESIHYLAPFLSGVYMILPFR